MPQRVNMPQKVRIEFTLPSSKHCSMCPVDATPDGDNMGICILYGSVVWNNRNNSYVRHTQCKLDNDVRDID